MWFSKKTRAVFLTDTLSGKKELFVPRSRGAVSLYSCGPTVYGPAHIGNLRAYIFSDTLARTLADAGYKVKRVINITDVGHLVGDGDEGEDKMAVGAKRESTTPEGIANRYTALFLADIRTLNLAVQDICFPRATAYIPQQISMIRALEKNGLTYKLSDGIYFDTEKFGSYGALGNIKNVQLESGARVEAVAGKKNLHDFVLWRFAKPHDLQQWNSPWGSGNPGWSIECSAMACALLGAQIDIHTGGMDHITVHHNNEIAQSEGATGKHPFVRYWMHNAFISIGGEKISKSLGNTYSLADLERRGIDPLALRYFFLQAHYRTPLSFSWDALEGAGEALIRLRRIALEVKAAAHGTTASSDAEAKLRALVADDLSTPAAIAHLWDSLKNPALTSEQKYGLLVRAEALLGLSLFLEAKKERVPSDVQTLANDRENARLKKDFAAADRLRAELQVRGYRVDDTPSGPVLSKIDRE